MKENTIEASIRRHGEKDSRGELSAEGVEHSERVAESFVAEIRAAPKGSLFFIMPSTVGRAKATRDAMESVFRRALESVTDVEVLSIQNRPDWSKLKDRKYVVTDFQPSSLIGYSKNERENSANGYWDSVKDLLEDDKMAAFRFWCADKEELAAFKAEMKAKHPSVSAGAIDELNPKRFDFTPEEYALKGFQWLERMRDLARKHVPERPVRFLGISHDDISDFLTLKLLGYKLNSKTLEEQGSLRGFLEESSYTFTDEGLHISYRGEKKFLSTAELKDFPNRLRAEVESRKAGWNSGK